MILIEFDSMSKKVNLKRFWAVCIRTVPVDLANFIELFGRSLGFKVYTSRRLNLCRGWKNCNYWKLRKIDANKKRMPQLRGCEIKFARQRGTHRDASVYYVYFLVFH